MNLMKIFSKPIPPGTKDDKGKEIKPGTKLVRGANCPKCGTFHALAVRVSACNYCGWHILKNTIPKAWMYRKHDKIQARQKKWADERKEKQNALQAG